MSINTPGNPDKFIEEIKQEINNTKGVEELKEIVKKVQIENLGGNIDDDGKDNLDQLVLERAAALGINIEEFITGGQNVTEFEELTDVFAPVDNSPEVNPFSSGIELPKINLKTENNEGSDYEKCLKDLEDFSGMLDHNQLLNIFNSNFKNNEEKEELYLLWIQDLIKTENEDRIESSLKTIILENPDFNDDLKLIVDLLPNLNSSDKEKLLRELNNAVDPSENDFLKEHNTFFEENNNNSTEELHGNEVEGNNFEEDTNDENTVQEQAYVKNNTAQETRSNVRNSLLAAVGLLAIIGIGVQNYNKNNQVDNTQNINTLQENPLVEKGLLDLDTGNDREELTGTGNVLF